MLALALQGARDRWLEAVVDAPHALGMAHPTGNGEARDVVGDGNDQVLARRHSVVDQADERIQEKPIVVVAG